MAEIVFSRDEQIANNIAMDHSRKFIEYCEEHWDTLSADNQEFQRLFMLRNQSAAVISEIMDRKAKELGIG